MNCNEVRWNQFPQRTKEYWVGVIQSIEAQMAKELGVSNETAEKILKERPFYTWSNPFIFNFHRHEGWHLFNTTHVTNVTNIRPESDADNKAEEKKKKEASWKTAMIVGGVVGVLSAFSFGYFYTRAEKYSQDFKQTRGYVQELSWENFHKTYSIEDNPDLESTENCKAGLEKALKFITEYNAIQRDRLKEATWDCRSAMILLSGAISTFAGGTLGATFLVTAGYVAMFAATMFFLVNKGMHWGDNEKHNETRLQNCLGAKSAMHVIQFLNGCFDENMIPYAQCKSSEHQESEQRYVPVFDASDWKRDLPPEYEEGAKLYFPNWDELPS